MRRRRYLKARDDKSALEAAEELRASGYEIVSGPVEVYAPRERSDDENITLACREYRVVVEDGKDE